MKSLACCTALLCLWVSVTAQDSDRQIFEKIQSEIIDGTYTARVEVTRSLKDAEETFTLIEYHDGAAGLHSVEQLPSERRTFFFKNSRTGTGTIVDVESNRTCKSADVVAAAEKSGNFIYKSNDAISPAYYLGPTTVVIEMIADTTNWTSLSSEVRGIKAKEYSNLDKNDGNKKTITIWMADDWDIRRLSAKDVPFPLRAMVEEDGTTFIFDYYQVEDLSPKEAFRLASNLQLPFGTYGCDLPKTRDAPPSLQTTFSFVSTADGSIVTREYFSIDDSLYRADQSDGTTVIHDDKNGLIYTLGNRCDIRPNPDVNQAILSVGSWNFGAQIVQAYLSLPNKIYIGEGFVRGIPVDVWDAVPDDNKDPNVKRARFFFSKTDAAQSANGNEGKQQLVKAIVLDALDHDEALDVDIYDFASSSDDQDFRKNFNVENCVEASMFVEVDLRADQTFNIEEFKLSNAMKEVVTEIEDKIEKSTYVSFLQLPSSRVEVVDGNNITVFLKILSPPPYLKSFTVRKDMVGRFPGSPKDAANEEECAKRCTESKESCPTFLYCGTQLQCQLMSSKNQDDWGAQGAVKECYVYDHVKTSNTMQRKTLDEISETLDFAVMNLWEPFKVSLSEGQSRTLRPAGFFGHLTQFNQQGRLGPYMLQYEGKSIREKHESSVLVEGDVLTVGQCYRECRNNKDIACSSFSICTAAKRCVLTSENINAGTRNDIDQANTIQDATTDCSVHSMNYLSEFDRLDGKSLKIGAIELKEGKTAGDCAVRCRQQQLDILEDCKSFVFCPKAKMCYFYRTHYNWDGGNDTLKEDGDCDHYALRFSSDYTAIGKGAFPSKPATINTEVTFEECAKQCSERSNGQCKTISYCDSNVEGKAKMTCYLYTDDITDLSDANNQEPSCTIYTELVSYNDDLINPKRQIDAERETNHLGMSDGGLAGLLIAMVVVGAILGAVGWFQREKVLALVGRSSGSSSADVAPTISYNRQEDESADQA